MQIAISSDLCIRSTWNLTGSCGHQQQLRGWSRMVVKQFQDCGRPPFWKSLYRHISAKNHPLSMKFCTHQQILNWMNVTWSKTKKLHWTDSKFDRRYFLFPEEVNLASPINTFIQTFYNFSVTQIVRMIQAKFIKFSKFVKVTAKILSVPFWGTWCSIVLTRVECLHKDVIFNWLVTMTVTESNSYLYWHKQQYSITMVNIISKPFPVHLLSSCLLTR